MACGKESSGEFFFSGCNAWVARDVKPANRAISHRGNSLVTWGLRRASRRVDPV